MLKRVSIACRKCRSRKRRCNGELPCLNCQYSGSTCEFDADNKRKPATNKYVASLLSRIETLTAELNRNGKPRGSFEGSIGFPYLYEESQENTQDESSPNEKNSNREPTLHIPKLVSEDFGIKYSGPASARVFKEFSGFGKLLTTVLDNFLFETSVLQSIDLHHQEIFEWYFVHVNKVLPMVSKSLFYDSLSEPGLELGPWASNSLINAMTALFYAMRADSRFSTFEELLRSQLQKEISYPNITNIQALVLLSIVEMMDNREHLASVHVAMACSLAASLGIHLDCEKFIEKQVLTREEASSRSLTFWCCFMVDRIRGPILGSFPYFVSPISTKITLPPLAAVDDMVVLRSLCSFLDIQDKTLARLYSDNLDCNTIDEIQRARKLWISESRVMLETWHRDLHKASRDHTTPQSLSYFLKFSLECYMINLYRPIFDPNATHGIEESKSPMPLLIKSARTILDLAENINSTTTPFLYQFAYGVFISGQFFLGLCTFEQEDTKSLGLQCFHKSLSLLDTFGQVAAVSKLYKVQLEVLATESDIPRM